MSTFREWAMRFNKPEMTRQTQLLIGVGGVLLVIVALGVVIFSFNRNTQQSSGQNDIECRDIGDPGYTTGGYCPQWKDVGFVQVFVDSYENPLEYYALEEKGVENNRYVYRLVNENKSQAINVDLSPMRKLKNGDKIVVSSPSEDIQFSVVLYS